MKKVFNKIIRLFSIDLSSKHISDALHQNENIIILRRHQIFLLRVIWLQLVWCLLMGIYAWIIINYAKLSFTHIMTAIAIMIFLYRIYISVILYKKNFIKRKTFYIGKETEILTNTEFLTEYIANALLIGILLIIDIGTTITLQVSMNPFDSNLRWVYAVEIIIFILLIIIISKTVKAQLDFEMDQVIFSPWSVKLIDREWFYTIESKIYIWSQIQTIEINKLWWLDSMLETWTLRIRTSTTWNDSTSKVFSFGRIKYSEVIENKLRAVIYST